MREQNETVIPDSGYAEPPVVAKVKRGLSLTDSAMLIIGSMIGSGVFIVSSNIANKVASPGLLILSWVVAGVMTICGALSYGELAAAMPAAGGQYVYLREIYNRLVGFLYGWTLFGVIQTGTIAAVAMAFASYTGEFIPQISGNNYVFFINSLNWGVNTKQMLAITVIMLLTSSNFRSVKSGARLQNLFTLLKIGSLLGLILIGFYLGAGGQGSTSNFSPALPVEGLSIGLMVSFFAAMSYSLFSSDAWNNVTFLAGEVQHPQRNLPRALILGTGTVTLLYILANLAYMYVLPIDKIAAAPDGRVATLLMNAVAGNNGRLIMAAVVMVSTFGCLNGIILSGARVYYAMAKDRLFLPQAARLNKNAVPANALLLQGIWASLLTLTGQYGNLLDFVMFSVLLFYILTIAGVYRLRRRRPNLERPYKTLGYPFVPAIYLILAVAVCAALIYDQTKYAGFGLLIVLAGIPVFYYLERKNTEVSQ